MGALPSFPSAKIASSVSPDSAPPTATTACNTEKSPVASLIGPFEALTLLIAAIGHDVGHPGVNNGFLIVLNTPLAQLYNDRSVLESFHCAAYSQILRRYWPTAFNDSKMRSLMISTILATDMGLHFDYMKKLARTQELLTSASGAAADHSWAGDARALADQTALACALLIKCADISNVARRHDVALQWMHILSDEFSRQACMENELGIKSSLAAEPKKGKINLFRAQLSFMTIFALPLFQGVANVIPAMQYCVDELAINKIYFDQGIAEAEKEGEGGATERDPAAPAAVCASNIAADKPPQTAEAAMSSEAQSSQPASNQLSLPLSHAEAGDDSFVAAFAASDPFGLHTTSTMACPTAMAAIPNDTDLSASALGGSALFDDDDGASQQRCASPKHRVSEATDGSASLTNCGGDWASQATSATTGKMPVSPSTRGTSIISQGSNSGDVDGNRASGGVCAGRRSASPSAVSQQRQRPAQSRECSCCEGSGSSNSSSPNGSAAAGIDCSERNSSSLNDNSTNSSTSKLQQSRDGRNGRSLLKKKSSRFRMNALTFLRRHLSTSPTPVPAPAATDAAASVANGHACAHALGDYHDTAAVNTQLDGSCR